MKCVLAVPLLLIGLMAAGAEDRVTVPPAPPKKGRTVDPPLSASLPAVWQELPLLGRIDWQTEQLPWVAEGPYAGISGVAMAAWNDTIVVTGGFIPAGDETTDRNSRRTSRWTWLFDPATGKWQQLPDAPIRREYTRAIVHGDTFYLIGGGCQYREEDPKYRVHGEVAVLDLGRTPPVWQLHSRLGVPRTHTSIGCVGHQLIVAGGNEYEFSEGGYSANTIRDTCEVFDLSRPQQGWQTRAALPDTGRGWSASIATSGHLYVFGGLTWKPSGAVPGLRNTLRYDPANDRWDTRQPAPLAISGWEGDLYADRYVLMVGGVVRAEREPTGNVIWSDLVWAYDLQDDQWLRVEGTLPPGAVFNDPGVVVQDNTVYVLGAEGPHGSHYNYFLTGRIRTDAQ